MSKEYTAKEAAILVNVSDSRIRQLCSDKLIDHKYFGQMLVITEKGLEQAKARNVKKGRPFKNTMEVKP